MALPPSDAPDRPQLVMLGVPVRVAPSFFVFAALLGLAGGRNLASLLAWVGVVLVSVLWHEFGHAFAFRAFGYQPSIQLFAMGGATSAPIPGHLPPARSLVISAAGPAVGLLLGGAVAVFERSGSSLLAGEVARQAVSDAVFANVAWGLFNLLPIIPLDGGGVTAALLDLTTGGRGERPARYISIVVAAAAAVVAVRYGQPFAAMVALFFCAANYSALKEPPPGTQVDYGESLKEGFAALARRDLRDAQARARRALSDSAVSENDRARATRLLFWTVLVDGNHLAVASVATELPGQGPVLDSEVAGAVGGREMALELLRQEVVRHPPDGAGAILARALMDAEIEGRGPR